MIKLQITALNYIPQSNFNLLNSILTVNTLQFDLSKPESITEDQESPVYRLLTPIEDSEDFKTDIIVKLNIPANRKFMFTYGNLFRFFDIDGNGILTVDELKVALDYILETDTVKLKARIGVIKDAFFDPKIKQGIKLSEIKKLWWDKGFPKK